MKTVINVPQFMEVKFHEMAIGEKFSNGTGAFMKIGAMTVVNLENGVITEMQKDGLCVIYPHVEITFSFKED